MTVIVPGWWRGQIVRGRVACSQGSQVVGVVPGLPPVSLLPVPVVVLQSQYVSPQLRLRAAGLTLGGGGGGPRLSS